MTKTDIALALLLWRNMNLERYSKSTQNSSQMSPTTAGLDKNDEALECAKRLGVKKEYLDLLFELPVMTVVVEELERWPEKKPRKKRPKNWSQWKPKGSGGKDRG